jgi:prepilin-type N-terminal cleavage/methylation domain-containing protein
MIKEWVRRRRGFTIVELLIIVAVIGILVTIVLVSYNSTQARSRDVRRKSDISIIVGYLELYAAEHQGLYPTSSGATATINAAWSTTAEPASWAVLEAALAPYGRIPKDPISTQGGNGIYSSNYAYFGGHQPTAYCGGKLQYLITYQLEAETNAATGTCPATDLNYSPTVTTYRKITN